MSYDFEDESDKSPPQYVVMKAMDPTDRMAITILLELAAIHLSPTEGSTFSFDELHAEFKELAGPDIHVEASLVADVLSGLDSIERIDESRYRLR